MTASTHPASPFSATNLPEYFQKLSKDYAQQTGNTTRSLFTKAMDDLNLPIDSSSIVHDNACGPGTATIAILERMGSRPPTIKATDWVPAMVDVLSQAASAERWVTVETSVMDAHNLRFADGTFTHSITNFSVFAFRDGLKCLREIYRTLKLAGVAVVTTWKRFGVSKVVHQAQRAVRPDLPPMKVPGAEFQAKGFLLNLMVEAGFDKDKVEASEKSIVVKGDDLEGLIQFMAGPLTAPARAGWTDDEISKWDGVIAEAVEAENEEFGGVRMEAWVVSARK